MNENQLTIVKEYKFNKPDINKLDSIIDKCIRDCHYKYYHTFEYKQVFDVKLTNISKIEMNKLTISDKSMGLYELNKKFKIARGNAFLFNQILKLTKKNLVLYQILLFVII